MVWSTFPAKITCAIAHRALSMSVIPQNRFRRAGGPREKVARVGSPPVASGDHGGSGGVDSVTTVSAAGEGEAVGASSRGSASQADEGGSGSFDGGGLSTRRGTIWIG